MNKKLLILIVILTVVKIGIAQSTQHNLPKKATSKDYSNFPDSIRKVLYDSLSYNLKQGYILDTIEFKKDTLYKKYSYSFMNDSTKFKGIVNVLSYNISNQKMTVKAFPIEIPIEQKCCKKNGVVMCFNVNDTAGIERAKNEGCTEWFNKFIRQ